MNLSVFTYYQSYLTWFYNYKSRHYDVLMFEEPLTYKQWLFTYNLF